VRLAFDADVLIYAAAPGHEIGQKILNILQDPRWQGSLVGSVLLLPELLSKPTRLGLELEVNALLECLSRLELLAIDATIASLAVDLGAAYKLKAPDAIHLASAVVSGVDAFVTNNARDFDSASILEVRVVFPPELDALEFRDAGA
jgi:predicted nucleic acid-binding protein